MKLNHRRIFTTTKLMGLIGRGIDYSLSPVIHNAAALDLRKDFVYLNIDLQADNLGQVLQNMWSIGAFGFNVTTPFKEVAAKVLNSDLLSINTIFRGTHTWQTASTDYVGFEKALLHHCKPLSQYNKIVFLGFGGASKAILEGLTRSSQWVGKSIEVYNRTEIHRSILEKCGAQNTSLKKFSDFGKHSPDSSSQDSLLIQSIPSASLASLDDQKLYCLENHPGTIFDLNYASLHHYFYRRLNQNLPTTDGLSMLIYQALESQKIWWGNSFSYEQAKDAIKDSGLLNALTTT